MTPLRPVLILALALAVAGCSHSAPKTLTPKGGYKQATADPRPLVDAVTEVQVAPTLSGAVVTAKALMPTQGWWAPALIAENDGKPVDGVMTYRFVAAPPPDNTADAHRVSTPQSREITAGAFIKASDLAQVRKVVVTGTASSRSASR